MPKPACDTSILAGFKYGCQCKVKLTNRSRTQSRYCTNMMHVTYYPHNNDSHHQKTHLGACMHTVQPATQPHHSRHTPKKSFRWTAVLAWVQASSSSFKSFPKFFAVLPQGTCDLSVSSTYLDLYGTYNMFCTPFPRSVTATKLSHIGRTCATRDFHPSCHFIPKNMHTPHWQNIITFWKTNCKHKQITIHAQLLNTSHLDVCPLPTYMLKFSRSLHQNPRMHSTHK